MPLAAWRESSLEEKNMLSISQNNICLPASPFRTINKIREHTMATGPLPSPSAPPRLPPLYPLSFCSCSFASTMQTFRGLSAPPLLGELQHKTSLCRQAAEARTHTHTRGEAQINTQERKLTQKLIHSCHRRAFSLACTQSPCPQPTCSQRNEPKTNQQRVI